jgi:glycerol transport system substrate-binding protein
VWTRGGDTNGPAAVYALTKYIDWLKKYAPPGGGRHDLLRGRAGARPGCNIAQQIFWYTAFTADMAKPGTPVVDENDTPEVAHGTRRPHGPYWEEGMKLGYQDAGSWTLMKSTPVDRRKAAWLYAQFVISKSVSPEEEPCRSDPDPRKRYLA